MILPRLRGLSLPMVMTVCLLTSGCVTTDGVVTDSGPLILQPTTTPPSTTESVLKYAGDPAPSGRAEHVTVTDSAGNTLYDQAYTGQEITVPVPADGKLFIATRWTEGRTRQELNVVEAAPGMVKAGDRVSLSVHEQLRHISVKTRSLAEIPVLGHLILKQSKDGATPATPFRVTITDSTGRTLYSGPPRADHVYDVPVIDRTLVVSTAWTNGKTTRQEIRYTDQHILYDDWDDYILLTWDPNAAQYRINPPRQFPLFRGLNLHHSEVSVGTGKLDDQPPSIGVVTVVDRPLHPGPDKVDFWNVNVGLGLGAIGKYRATLGLGTARGDESTRQEVVPGGGMSSGWSYQGGPGPSGSTGIASAGGTRSSFSADYESQSIQLMFSEKIPDKNRSGFFVDYSIKLQRSVRDYSGHIQLITSPTVTSTDRQEITQYDLSAGIGVRGRRNLANGWQLSGGAAFDAIYYRGKYQGSHHYICPPCANPADRDFAQSSSDRESGFTWGARLWGRFNYAVSGQTDLHFGVDYHRQDDAPMLRNRTRPSDPAPHLYDDNFDAVTVRVGLNHRF